MRRVVDASVAVKWFVPEIFEHEAGRLLEGGYELHAPDLILPEFSNIVWKKIRRDELTEAEGQRIITAFVRTSMRVHPHKQVIISAFTGAVMTGQTVYDWTYLSLALALSCEFVTADDRFYRALEATPLKKHLIRIGDV